LYKFKNDYKIQLHDLIHYKHFSKEEVVMKKILVSFLIVFYTQLFSQTAITPYYERNDFLFASSGALKFGLYGYDNPALLTYLHQPDMLFIWSDQRANWKELKRWGLFAAIPKIGFGTIHEQLPIGHYADYRLSISTGDRDLGLGIGYGWTRTKVLQLEKSDILILGTLYRPARFLSAGITLTEALNTRGYEIAGDIAIRPLGNEKIALFADYAVHRTSQLNKDMWSAGIVTEFLPGVRITGRYFNTDAFSVGLQFSLGRIELQTQAHYNPSHKYDYNVYGIRFGAYDRNVISKYFSRRKDFVKLIDGGRIDYQKFALFDNTRTLSNLIKNIEIAKEDPYVAGIVINTSNMEVNQEIAWELRKKLLDFKASGKKIFIFIDQCDINTYHFASVADKIVMDPLGTILLQGYVMGRTYFKGTLEKIGIGFDEWRFFKYKSAAETISRDKMSDADREQRQKVLDDWYKIAREEICSARRFTFEKFDSLVNNAVIFFANQAKETGLIDSIGRWDKVKELVKSETGKKESIVSEKRLEKHNLPYDDSWGEQPKIAVIYALGACAMDEGIKARKLVKDVEAAVDNSKVKAIILRVDSPGGDAMASDYIAEALKKAKGKKPVIVSQGFVAASGGYWLSMYGDTIVSSPITITGSIGVIGGWYYDNGLKSKLGVSTDFVKVGEHADLGFGFTFPLINATLPDRNLTQEERAVMEKDIKLLYKEFVEKVAHGRKKTADEIEQIAEGRIWTGLDAQKNGLVDLLGGLDLAIEVAKQSAGIPKHQEVSLIELPKKGLIDFSKFMPKLIGLKTTFNTDPTIELLKFHLKHNGKPMPMLPMEDLDVIMKKAGMFN